MPSKPAKPHANVRVRRHSASTSSSSRPKKIHSKHKHKDSDSASITTNSTSSNSITENSPQGRCPLRSLLHLTGIFGPASNPDEDDTKEKGCPLRRAQLWHTIPLCILAIINLLLIIIALLGLASYRIVVGAFGIVETLVMKGFADTSSTYPTQDEGVKEKILVKEYCKP